MESKKSKVLAIAFCAAVMSGIYVNPVLAKDVSVNEHGNVTIRPSDFDNGPWQPDSVTITGIASQEAVEDAQLLSEIAAAKQLPFMKHSKLLMKLRQTLKQYKQMIKIKMID